MQENYMISTTISYPRTFHVEMLLTRDTREDLLKKQNLAPVKDLQGPETENATVEHY